MNESSKNKRIAKNTLFLYFRTFLVLLVSLYTSRVILRTLGETDFGIYNIVGGVVVLFSFLNQAMSTATLRFLNYALGKEDIEGTHRIFSMSLTVHIAIALLVILLAETIGLWFLNTQLSIPQERMVAANWVYQFSVLGCCLQIVRIPYNASIIAYERMSFYAYISIIEAFLKLSICYLLIISPFDRLATYGLLMLATIAIVNVTYQLYCNKKFTTTHYKYFWDKGLFVKLTSFSGWSLLVSSANITANQGINILFNIFIGVIANAAMGIVHQVTSAFTSFIESFQTAFIPQLVKSYASGDDNYFNSLIFRTSRFSFFLVWVIGFPIILCCGTVMKLWLGNVPEYTVEFVRLFIVFCIISACSSPLWNAIQATGNIKKYGIVLSSIIVANLPIAYLMLKIGISPAMVVFVRILLNVVAHIYRILYLQKHIQLNVVAYLKQVMSPIATVVILSSPIPIILMSVLHGLAGNVIVAISTIIICLIVIPFFGMTQSERKTIVNQIKLRLFPNN